MLFVVQVRYLPLLSSSENFHRLLPRFDTQDLPTAATSQCRTLTGPNPAASQSVSASSSTAVPFAATATNAMIITFIGAAATAKMTIAMAVPSVDVPGITRLGFMSTSLCFFAGAVAPVTRRRQRGVLDAVLRRILVG